jgi:hypothetical protein
MGHSARAFRGGHAGFAVALLKTQERDFFWVTFDETRYR